MAAITIRHTRADGTVCDGTARGDGTAEILGASGRCRFRWSRNIGPRGAWYVPQSRDKAADTYGIERRAEALRAAGHDVTVEIDETVTRSFAEAEAERYERAEDRAGRMAGHAENAAQRAASLHAQARQMSDAIPFGQPMMPDHYSYGRDKRYRERIGRTYERSFAEAGKAEHFERRAANAETYRAHRESVPVTLRRIDKIRADLRRVERALDGELRYFKDADGNYGAPRLVKPEGARLAQLEQLRAEYSEQIAYWEGVVKAAQESGVKVWSAADFSKGDFVLFLGTWYEVLRVNPKSVTIPGMIGARGDVCTRQSSTVTWTDTVPYHKVKGRKTADEIAGMETAADAHAQV